MFIPEAPTDGASIDPHSFNDQAPTQEYSLTTFVCKTGRNIRYIVAPNPSFVFFILAVSGASNPPDNPMRSPSAHPIIASILKPMFVSPILGAA